MILFNHVYPRSTTRDEMLGTSRSIVSVAPPVTVSSIFIFSKLSGSSPASHATDNTACSPCSSIVFTGPGDC